MDAQRREEITGWDAREFSDGFAGLRRLVDREFSGAVTDGSGWLFVFEGRVVGTVDSDLDAFADASGTVYRAPHETLPVLFAMQEQGGEPRAQYYTNDTPLSEADRKLSQGGFTGYIELSENVLSGDYYVTYTAGESMAAAYVGNSRRLETGEDAFALADDEVGIYNVYEVDLNVREIPSGDGTAGGNATGSAGTVEDHAGTAKTAETAESAEIAETTDPDRDIDEEAGEGSNEAGEADAEAGEADVEQDGPGLDDPSSSTTVGKGSERGDIDATPSKAADTVETGTTETNGTGTTESTEPAQSAESTDPTGPAKAGASSTEARSSTSGVSATTEALDESAGETTPVDETTPADEDVFSEEEQWREQKSIPALDPSEASDPPSRSGKSAAKEPKKRSRDTARSRGTGHSSTADASTAGDDRSPDPRSTERTASNSSAVSQRSSEPKHGGKARERIRQLETALEAAETERESLAEERKELATERDKLVTERDEFAAEIDRLKSEASTLREERDSLREELSAVRERLPESERTLSPAEARSGTNLFVRYDSKGGATLEDAHDGDIGRDALRENLRIEHHTSFETDGLAVDGRPFEEFLEETIEYGFTRWLVEDLPFEVSETGNQSVLRDLYDALPEIDRAEIGGSVSIAIRENGEETREQRTFDLVLRDRMGNPLFVADLNDSRDPTAEGTLESLVGNGRDIAESNDSFAAAFAVTESFFEPGALETASDAVGGGLFSRSKRASFVKLSRKRGYHLCLVEARDGGFHMTVPDL